MRGEIPQKILAINFGGIGDEVLFLPTLQALRSSFPQSTITLLLEPRAQSIGQITGLIDKILTFDIKQKPLTSADLAEILGILKDGGYDLVVSSGSSILVSILLFMSGIEYRVGYGTSRLSRLLLTHPVKLDRSKYAASMYHDLAKVAISGLARHGSESSLTMLEEIVPKILAPVASLESMRALLEQCEAEYMPGYNQDSEKQDRDKITSQAHQGKRFRILLHPGTSRLALEKNIIKTWPSQNWHKLISELLDTECSDSDFTRQIILAGGPDDQEIIDELRSRLSDRYSSSKSTSKSSASFIDFYGKTKNLADLSALIELSDLVICVDSAPMHMAVALSKPLVALFGPTAPGLLLPDSGKSNSKSSRIEAIIDERGGERHMYDGLGLVISPERVLESVIALESRCLGKAGMSISSATK